MKYTFKTTEENLNKWKLLVKEKWWKFYTDWTFEVKWVEWEINFKDWLLSINITDKPWLASWDMIEEELNKFFN